MFPRLPLLSAFCVLLALPTSARAAEPREAAPPSSAWLILGGAGAAAGIGVELLAAHWYRRADEDCLGQYSLCDLTYQGGTLLTLAGGAGMTAWAWKLGDHHARERVALGGEVPSARGVRNAGLAIAGIGLLARTGLAVFIGVKNLDCFDAQTPEAFQRCGSRAIGNALMIDAAFAPVLIGGAMMAGYGFGHDTAARAAGVRLSLMPLPLRGGAGLAFRGDM